MVNLALYAKTQDFFEFCKTLELENCVFIVPNPRFADTLRHRFESSMGLEVESITISKFMQNEIELLIPDFSPENYKSKSELLLVLGTIWKKTQTEHNYINFTKAFNLLTEFRSFSVADQVLETVLEFYDEELASGVIWLHRFIKQLGHVDEHGSYFLISEKLREQEPPPEYQADRTLIFCGFDFMTASQVDMLKSLSLRDNVVVPFYTEAYDHSSSLDWIRWFDPLDFVETRLGREYTSQKTNDLYYFPKNYMGHELERTVIENKSSEKIIILGCKQLERENFFEVPFNDVKTKISVDVFEQDFISVSKFVEQLIDHDYIKIIEDLKKEAIGLSKEECFKQFKICLLYIQKIEQWAELTDDNQMITLFDFETIKESTLLDLPRVNLASLSTSFKYELGSLLDIENFKDEKILFAVNSSHNGAKGVGSNFSEKIEKYLISIGPIRRAELDRYILRCKFKEFVDDNDVKFLVEAGLDHEDSNISSLLSPFSFNYLKNNSEKDIIKVPLAFQKTLKSITSLSASRLQKYLECPQKFYFGYVEKIFPRVELSDGLNVLELGRIEHEVIEKYFKKNSSWDDLFHDQLIESIIESYISEKDIINKDSIYIEVKTYTQSAIIALVNFKKDFALNFQFEKEFKLKRHDLDYRGSVDLFAISDDLNVIIDFKRSNRVFSSAKMILDFDQVQLWFYYNVLEELKLIDPNKKIILGYIDLSNFENTLLITNDKLLAKDLKATFGKISVKLVEEFIEVINEYKNYEMQTVNRLKSDKNFFPRPYNAKVCDFCPVYNTCSRESC